MTLTQKLKEEIAWARAEIERSKRDGLLRDAKFFLPAYIRGLERALEWVLEAKK